MEKAIKKYWPFFLLPTLAAFIIGFVWPFLWGIFLSFHKFTTISKTTFVGLDNYLKVFQDEHVRLRLLVYGEIHRRFHCLD